MGKATVGTWGLLVCIFDSGRKFFSIRFRRPERQYFPLNYRSLILIYIYKVTKVTVNES